MKRSSFQRILSFISHGSDRIEKKAENIARQCRTSLMLQIVCRANSLSPDQLRGYARAYAIESLEPAIKVWIATERPNTALISNVICRAREMLIDMAIGDMQVISPPVVADIATAA